jgi:ABC-type polysaccharide/polyol phosphate transport system ATPase subunit
VNAISVKGLGKRFKLFPSPGKRFLEYLSAGRISGHSDFWALQDISFEIPAGTTLGILGQNGSGKSTLLSILAGVLYPSAGTFEIHGKVSAILELGSGFHPEFSGRDNVYMYGSIMGLSKEEVDERFEEIARFSELGDFIDQPLRTYSSGMIVRLAFSVAVNVNADILIVDEALAVGDAIFQHRCFRKIREMQESGKTILYVGHDTEAVRNLCTQALLLDGGRIIERGDPNIVVNKYLALISERERTYSEGNTIEHGEVPGEEYETMYDLVRNFSEATIESAMGIPVQPQTVEIQSKPRSVIFAHPPSEITYTIPVESGSFLAFAIGILPGAWEKIPQGVKFDIDVSVDGTVENIFTRVLQPNRNIGDRGWHNFIVPLENYSGKSVSIVFRTSGSGKDLSYCWSTWGWGKIVRLRPSLPASLTSLGREGTMDESDQSTTFWGKIKRKAGNKRAEILRAEIVDENNVSRLTFHKGEVIYVRFFVRCNGSIKDNITAGCTVRNKFQDIYATNTRWKKCDLHPKNKEDLSLVTIKFPAKLGAGMYSITPAIAIIHSDNEIFTSTDVEVLDCLEDRLWVKIVQEWNTGLIDLDAEIEICEKNSIFSSELFHNNKS